MKRWASLLLAAVLLFAGLFAGAPKVYAAQEETRTDDVISVKTELYATQTYIVISKLAESDEFVVKLTMNSTPLTAEDFKRVSLKVDCGGIKFKATPNEKDSSYSIKLLQTDGLTAKNYQISVTATYTDPLGRVTQTEDSVGITLGATPLWLKWLVSVLTLLLLILIIWQTAHIKVIPSAKILHNVNEATLFVNGKERPSATLRARRRGKKLEFRANYLGNNFIVNISNVKPGDKSYTFLREVKRSFLIHPNCVTKVGNITHVEIGGRDFKLDKTGKLVPDGFDKPFILRGNTTISFGGILEENGKTKSFCAEIPISFKTTYDHLKDLQKALFKALLKGDLAEMLHGLNEAATTKQSATPAASAENNDTPQQTKQPETPASSVENNIRPQQAKKYAFISYSTKNQSYANAMRNLFNKHNIDTWMAPYDIPAGSKYAAVITKAIRECSCFVLLLSNDSQASEAVDQEVELAVMEYKKSIITIELEKVVLNDAFTFYVHNKQIIAAHKFDENSAEMKQVLDAVKAYTDR